MDVFSKKKRSDVMRRIRSKNTKPEIRIRRGLHRLGYRFRLHSTSLPGKPDIVLPKFRTAIQVRGCFWHAHTCNDGHTPKSSRLYWIRKLKSNVTRDLKNDRMLRRLGWNVLIVWECQCDSDPKAIRCVARISRILKKKGDSH